MSSPTMDGGTESKRSAETLDWITESSMPSKVTRREHLARITVMSRLPLWLAWLPLFPGL